MASGGSGWPQLRQQARQQEAQTETLLQQFSQYASVTSPPAQPSPEEQGVEQQLSDVFQQRENTLSSMTRHLDSSPSAQPTAGGTGPALKSSHLSRHRQILTQHRSDLARLRSQVKEHRERANLLASVRSDISAYRTANASADDPHGAEAEYMLQERGRLDRSNREAEGVLSQAYAVNDAFGVQREQLERVRRRALQVAGMVPGVNSLIGRISTKKRRDGYILGSFIALCFLVFWFLL